LKNVLNNKYKTNDKKIKIEKLQISRTSNKERIRKGVDVTARRETSPSLSLFFSTREFRQWFSKRPIDRRVRSSSGLALLSPFDQSLSAPPRLSPSHSFFLARSATNVGLACSLKLHHATYWEIDRERCVAMHIAVWVLPDSPG